MPAQKRRRRDLRYTPKRLYIVPYHETGNGPGHDPDVRPKSPLRYSIVATYKGGALRMLNHGFKTHTAAEREVKVMEAVLDE